MRRVSFSALLLLILAGCAGTAPLPADEAAPRPEPVVAERPLPAPADVSAAFAAAIRRDTRTEVGLPGDAYWIQEASYTIETRLFPEDRRLEGEARILYENNSPYELRELHLELAQNLHAEGVARLRPAEVTGGVQLGRVAVAGRELSSGARRGPRYRVDGTQLVIVPARPVGPGETVEIETEWSYTVPQAGAGGRMGYSEDNLFFLAYWYPQMAAFDDVVGWFDAPFLGEAEFYADFADYDVTIEAPEGWLVAATGELRNADEVLAPAALDRMRRAHASDAPIVVVGPGQFDEATADAPDDRLRWRFTAERVRDFAFSATRESIWEAARTPVGDRDGDGEVDYTAVNTYYRATAPLWDDVTEYQQHALTFLSDFSGLSYPWPHMTAVEGAGIMGGGMEYPMMTLMGDYNTRGDSALYNVTAHELAHMWVPMMVNTNERRYSWIDEGFTTWHENQARQDYFPGPDHEFQDYANYRNVALARAEGELMRYSDYHYPGPAFVIASYMKPATLLRALRGLLGEETFMEAYHDFIDTWAWKHPYPYDLFNTFERVSGRDLDWFWRAWYYETWTLDQAIADVTTEDGVTEIVVEDRGRAPMPVDLEITLADGDVLRRTIPVDVWLSGATTASIEVATGSPVTHVAIDPERDFPDVDRENNFWTRGEAAETR